MGVRSLLAAASCAIGVMPCYRAYALRLDAA
jgi:hypothetical protein